MSADNLGVAGSLVGRDADVERLVELSTHHRLITLTGPGGVGKTRLARAAAARLVDRTSPRHHFCALAEVEDPAAVRHVVAARLGIVDADQPLRTVLAGSEPALVVVDNCEHVADAAAAVVEDLLEAGPHVTVLATSRESLRLDGEKIFDVRPLLVPVSADDPGAAESPAVQLFAERARAVRDDFALDGQTLPAVAGICRELDGLPLALEIAAARVRSMGVSDIAGRLGARFSLLRSGARDSADRHRSLRAVVDWSYRMLDDRERTVFDALAVFPAGADLDAATHTATAAGLSADEVVDAVDGLVAKSLLQFDTTVQPPRYRMLETLRAYGMERLRDAGRLEAARDRHAEFHAAMCEETRAGGLKRWSPDLARFFHDFDNVRAAIHWTLTADDDPDRSFRMLAPLWYVGLQQCTEIVELCDRALERWPEPIHPRHAEVHATAAISLIPVEGLAEAERHAKAAIRSGTSLVGVALGWRALAEVSALVGDPQTGLDHLDRAYRTASEAGFEPLHPDLLGLGVPMLIDAGRQDEALERARTGLAIARAQPNVFEHAWAMMLVGSLLIDGQPAEAGGYLTTALEESRTIGYPFGTMASVRGLGTLAAAGGRVADAAARFVEAVDLFTRAGMRLERWITVAAALPLLIQQSGGDVATVAAVHIDGLASVIPRLSAPGWESARDALLGAASGDTVARAQALGPDRVVAMVRSELAGLAARRPEPSAPRVAPAPVAPAPAAATAELRRLGDLWSVTFAGTTVHVPALRGIEDLAVLLENPGREVPALDLAGGPGLPEVGGDLGEVVDATARAAYARRIQELRAELDDADAAGDAERGARIGHELDTLTQHLATAYGLHGARRAGDPAERARAAVTSRVRAAVRKIEAVYHPLGRHLDRSVRTGRFCSYVPDEPVAWRVIRHS